jgi:CheY-like chemotaxis protein
MNKSRSKAAADSRPRSGVARAAKPPLVTILHIDDDPNDTELFQAAAQRANVRFCVQNVTDAEQAMAYLSGRGVYADRNLYPLPGLVLLDLKMPRATGFDVLSWIRNHPEVGSLPVVVFSGSELQEDIQKAYAGGADSYLVKPIGFNALIDLVKTINSSWISGECRSEAPLDVQDRGSSWQGASSSWFGDSGGNEMRA